MSPAASKQIRAIITALIVGSILHFSYKKALGQHAPNAHTYSDTSNYRKRAIAFIAEVIDPDFRDRGFVLINKPFNLYSDPKETGLDEVFKDRKRFPRKTLDSLRNAMYPAIIRWEGNEIPGIKVVNTDSVRRIAKDTAYGRTSYTNEFGTGSISLSSPIFIAHDSLCIFYQEMHCGWLCGRGLLGLYQKKDGKWVMISFYRRWVS